MEAEPFETADFANQVRGLVESHFGETGQGLLLSRLGQTLRSRGIDLPAVLAGRKLSKFIEDELGDAVTLSASLADPKIVSAVPVGRQPPVNIKVKASVAEPTPSIPRISPTVWAAFTKPIPDGHLRTLELSPPSFSDVPQAQASALSQTISAEETTQRVPGDSKSAYEQRVFVHIKAWLEKHGVALKEITADGVSMRHAHSKKSLFNQILDRLNDDQRRRVSLPLDVIEALLRA